MNKKYIKPKDNCSVIVYINNKRIKVNDVITVTKENAYYNNQRIDKDDSLNDMVYRIDNNYTLGGIKFTGVRYLVKYDSIFLSSYFIIYNKQEYRNIKLNTLLNE